MKKKLNLLQKMGISRPRQADEEVEMTPFEKRLKMVNRARVVNQAGLGGPVFRVPQTQSEA